MLYSDSIKGLTLGQGILSVLSSPCAISIYSGTQPAASDIVASWSSYNSSNANFLVHYVGATWYQPSVNLITISTYPAATAATNSGVATWAIIWSTNVSAATAAGSTLPTANFVVVPASNTAGAGVIRFIDNTMTSGVSNTIVDGSIKSTF